ncbi:MAG: PGRS family protein [Minicystis sp.]
MSSTNGDDIKGKGTKAEPYATFKKALAEGATIYACAGTNSYNETVVLDKEVTLVGGLDCAKWTYDEARRTTLMAQTDEIPLRLSSFADGSVVANFAITAANATKNGGSSIAVIAAGVKASFIRTDIKAGNAASGASGKPYNTVAQLGLNGNAGSDACLSSKTDGAEPVTNECGNLDSVGGSGGTGHAPMGDNGTSGMPLSAINYGSGDSGAGCKDGMVGEDGEAIEPAEPGMGATDLGTITADGYTGASGGQGEQGKPGQGGGGGGGAKGGVASGQCAGANSAAGASGGSGGSGGCGGMGGNGGMPGGSSIAVISVNAMLTFSDVKLTAGDGGRGGDGGDGQAGGEGGEGGKGGEAKNTYPNLLNACKGGRGGRGGRGGNGGGGRGGHTIGIAYRGTISADDVGFTPGAHGLGGKGADSSYDGAPGVQEKMKEFP